jgi:hypothetical protein
MKFKFFLFLFFAFTWAAQAQTSDTKDIQIAKQKLRVGSDNSKFFTSTTETINIGSTHRQLPTAKAVWDAIVAGGGGGGGGHIILDDDTVMDQREGLNFISTPTVSITASDDAANDETEIRLIVPNDGIGSNQISSGAVGTSEIADGSVTYAKLQNVATNRVLGRVSAGAGEVQELGPGSSMVFSAVGGIARAALTGDVTAALDDNATTIANNAVNSAKIADGSVALADMANMATSSLIYRKTAGTGPPEVNTLATLKTDLGITGNEILNGGNTTGAALTIGTNDNQNLIFETNNTARLTVASASITTGGNYTIGNSANTISLSSTSTSNSAIALNASNVSGSVKVGASTAYTHTTGVKTKMNFSGESFTASSGSGVFTGLLFNDTYDLTGTASGLQSSIDINPALTNLVAATYAAINIQANNASAIGINQTGSNTRNIFRGKTAIGSTTGPSEQLEVTGNATVAGKLASTSEAITLGASATTLAINRNVVKLTGNGTNVLATITGGISGQILTIIFVDALVSITDTGTGAANTVNLSAAFTSTANDTITLVSDGTSWFEIDRSVN